MVEPDAVSCIVSRYPSITMTEIHVTSYGNGFHVAVFDMDENEYYPSGRTFFGTDALEKANLFAVGVQAKAK